MDKKSESRAKVQAVFDEFTFLYRYFSRHSVEEARIQTWDEDMLNTASIDKKIGAADAPLTIHETYLLSREGHPIGRVGEIKKVWWDPNTWFYHTRNQKVYDKISGLGARAEEIEIVVMFNTGFGEKDDLVLYKPVEGYANIRDWIDSLVSEYRKDLVEG